MLNFLRQDNLGECSGACVYVVMTSLIKVMMRNGPTRPDDLISHRPMGIPRRYNYYTQATDSPHSTFCPEFPVLQVPRKNGI